MKLFLTHFLPRFCFVSMMGQIGKGNAVRVLLGGEGRAKCQRLRPSGEKRRRRRHWILPRSTAGRTDTDRHLSRPGRQRIRRRSQIRR